MTLPLRKLFFWLHLIGGVTAGAIILVMCVTGTALTYQRQMQYWADTHTYRSTPAPGASRAPAADLIAAARTVDPAAAPTTLTLRADPSAPAAVALGNRTIYVDPYTATLYGEGQGQGMRQFFSSMTSWHRYLATTAENRTTGRALTGASNLIFFFIVLSGMYLWWPRSLRWNQIRHVTWFRSGLPTKARLFNWHNVAGFWSAAILAVVVGAGVVMSYPWANNLVYRAMGEEPPAQGAGRGAAGAPVGESGRGGRGAGGGGGRGRGALAESPGEPRRMADAGAVERSATGAADQPAAAPLGAAPVMPDLDALLARAEDYESDRRILAMRIPTSATAPVTFTIDRGDGGQPHLRGTLTMDAYSGAVTRWEGFSSQTPGRRLRSFLRFAHTGEAGGLAGQAAAGLASAGGALLVYSGFSLAVRRLFAWRKRSRVSAAARAGS